jgi:hypothetical protein
MQGGNKLNEDGFWGSAGQPSLTRICMAVSFGGWMSVSLWLIVGNPWVGVFAIGAVLGVYVLENGALQMGLGSARGDIGELEKQVVGLRTTIDRMARLNTELECERRRLGFKQGLPRSKSYSSCTF